MTKKALIDITEVTRNEAPNYLDYAFVINKITLFLEDKFNTTLRLYSPDDNLEDLDTIIELLLKNKSEAIEFIRPVYNEAHDSTIHYSNEDHAYSVTPATIDNIFYFPEFGVSYVNTNLFLNHSDYPHGFLFANNDETIVQFVHYLEKLEREQMLDGINVLTDTDDGLARSNEKITHQIKREDVLLEDQVKRDIFRSIDEFFTEEGTFYKKYNIPYKRGILLYGQPGNGKTTLVKSIAESVDAPVVYWQITEYTSSYSIDEVFTLTNKLAPVILIIEDIDSMPSETRSVFLNALDGATSKEGIFLIGTTNYPEKIDPALINRAGRFDRAYEIVQPSEQLRLDYLKKKNIQQFITEEELIQLSKDTKKLSISQLNELYMSVALEYHYDSEVNLDYIVEQLIKNHQKTQKNDWDNNTFEDQMGF